ncbi:MAG TPA: glycosyltransferase family 2 protein [Pyrinomonadaceae bacterium]|jgi:glycosyltransferase involved in cell wall biosynthesis|nr:glycosyltransferase family 2 protein [Pyrinomonadaceae bacterium]
MPSVSVIITTHDRPHLLVRAIASARVARRRGLEIVVVDDASRDETEQVCRSLENIVYVRTERNQGVAGARNLGILRSSGDYLNFLDDDDVRLPGSLDAQIDALDVEPEAGFIYGQAILGKQDGSPTDQLYPSHLPRGDVFWELLTHNFVPAGTAVFRRSCLYRIGLLDDAVSGVDDWDLWIRLAEMYPVLALEQPVMVWRQATPDSGQGSSRAREMVRLSATQFRERWQELPRFAASSVTQRRETLRRFSSAMARHLLWEAWRAVRIGQIRTAQRNLLAALRQYPTETAGAMVGRAGLRPVSANNRRSIRAEHILGKVSD